MIVKGERLKQAILAALADTESQKILEVVMYQPKSVTRGQENKISPEEVAEKVLKLSAIIDVRYEKIGFR
jgi:hypothetical protein